MNLKETLKQIFHPPVWFVAGSVSFTALLEFFVFVIGGVPYPLEIATYLFSAYTLVIFVLSLKPLYQKLITLLCKIPLFDRIYHDRVFRSFFFFCIGGAFNLLYIFFNLYLGKQQHSFWFVALGLYHLTLFLLRLPLIRAENHLLFGDAAKMGEARQAVLYRRYGFLLLLLNAAIGGITYMAVMQNESYHYSYYMTFGMAAYAFYALILSLYNLFRYRAKDSLVLKAMKRINFFAALSSLFALQTALIDTFETADDAPGFRVTANASTGIAIFVVMLTVSLLMIFGKRKEKQPGRHASK